MTNIYTYENKNTQTIDEIKWMRRSYKMDLGFLTGGENKV